MRQGEKISVAMTPDMLRDVRECVEAGEYASASEVLRDALRLWRRQRIEDAERLAAIRERVRRSLDDPRPSLSANDADAHMRRFFDREAKDRDDAAA
jgi:antitoxin ParD1/3/4